MFVRMVITSNSVEKSFVTHSRTKHMQNPRTLLIVIRIQQFKKILCFSVEEWRALLFFVNKILLCVFSHVRLKKLFSFLPLNKETGEVSCEPFAQPQI